MDGQMCQTAYTGDTKGVVSERQKIEPGGFWK